jgi:peptide/nickel transport system ATP-binding protein
MPAARGPAPLLAIDDLKIAFQTARGSLPAVDGVSLTLAPGETLGLVGESACGKSTTCHAILRLTPANGRVSGRILFEGRDLLTLPDAELDAVRGRDIAMIFQDPMASLNPVHRIGSQIGEGLRLHQGLSGASLDAEVRRLLDLVGIPDAARRLREYPHQLSGGMNQRVGIAMALASRPRLLIADEPTTALDVTIQAQILDLLRALQREFGMGLILVTHDLGVVAEMASRVAVMYAGRIVETASARDLFARPQHPYTRGLLASIPALEGHVERLRVIEGHVPGLDAMPPGCAFAPRCTHALADCRADRPQLAPVFEAHHSACLRAAELITERAA